MWIIFSPEWLEECNSAAHNIMESTDDPDYGETKDSHLSPQKNETFLPLLLRPVSDIHLHNENASLEKHAMHNKLQSETEKAMNSGNQEDKTKDQLQPVICKEMSVEPNVLAGGKGNTAVFQLPRKRKDDFDLLSNFIMLRSKHVFSQREETNNAKIQEEGSLRELLQKPYKCNKSSHIYLFIRVLHFSRGFYTPAL